MVGAIRKSEELARAKSLGLARHFKSTNNDYY